MKAELVSAITTMNCVNQKANSAKCNCAFTTCEMHGKCCECIRYHLRQKQLPACCFPAEIAKTEDRSIKTFIKINNK